jgi:hypothetical protein
MPPKAVGAPAAAPAVVKDAAAPTKTKSATDASKPIRPVRKSTIPKPHTQALSSPTATKKRKQPSKQKSASKTPALKKVKRLSSSSTRKGSDSKQSKPTNGATPIIKDKDAPSVDPFKQIATFGRLPPVPVITLARKEDVTPKFRKNFPLAPRKSRAKPRPQTDTLGSLSPFSEGAAPLSSTTTTMLGVAPGVGAPITTIGNTAIATADGRVALRVIPGGQIPSRLKRPNDAAEAGQGAKKTKTKSQRPPSAADSSGVAATGSQKSTKLSAEWHPGMHIINGITLVEPLIMNALAPPPPPLVQESTPPRYRPMKVTASDLPEFDQEDITRGSIQFLRYIALCVGRITTSLPGRLQYTINHEQRVYRERLTRVLLARDGRHADKVRAGGTRRSTRTRFAPDVFIPTTDGRNSAYGDYGDYEIGAGGVFIQPFDPVELTDVRLGPMYQTELPQQRPRPAMPAEEESRWTENLILEASVRKVGVAKKNRVERPIKSVLPKEEENEESEEIVKKKKKPACDDAEHAAAIARQVSQLTTTVGPVVAEAFGLGTMGTDTSKNLTEEQQDQLYQGIKKYGRDFFKISRDVVSGNVRPRVLAAYYYDVWKLSGIPAAKRWFADKAAEEEQRIAEAKQQELLRAEEAARRAKSMEASNRRRQVKEAVQWVRGAGKNPHGASYNKFVVRERANRVLGVHKMIAAATVVDAEAPAAVVT